MHHLVNTLLLMGEEGSNHKKLENTTKISNHELQISAVMCYIKPGLMNIFFKRFERDVLRAYLHKVSKARYVKMEEMERCCNQKGRFKPAQVVMEGPTGTQEEKIKTPKDIIPFIT